MTRDQSAREHANRRLLVTLGVLAGTLWLTLVALTVSLWIFVHRATPSLGEALPELTSFVEQQRGLDFLHPVDAQVLGEEEFVAELRRAVEEDEQSEESDGSAMDPSSTLAALGLAPSPEEYDAASEESFEEGVLGFYDPATGKLYVRGERLTPAARTTLVHELVHALQDQHFDLDAGDATRPEDDESWAAWSALVEGDASAVDSAYGDSLSAPERAWLLAEQLAGMGGLPDLPVVTAISGFPYIWGEDFVGEVRDEGGTEALDQAFRDPPTTTEQIADGYGWATGHPSLVDAVEVPQPQVEGDGEVVDHGTLGVFGLSLLVSDGELFSADPWPFSGWKGDSYVTVQAGERLCTVASVEFDDEVTRRTAEEALGAWAVRDPGASSVSASGTRIRLESCGGDG